MKDYSKTKIYKIVSKQTDEIYVGSTIQTLSARMSKHRSDFKNGTVSSSCVLQYSDAKILLLENFPCNNCDEKRAKEQEWMDKIETICNKVRAYTDEEETKRQKKVHYDKNKEVLLKKKKVYHQKNKEVLAEKMKVYRQENKEEISEKRKEKVPCDKCGYVLRKNDMARHKRSNYCKNFEDLKAFEV